MKPSVKRHAVHGRAHGVLADAEVDVAPLVAPRPADPPLRAVGRDAPGSRSPPSPLSQVKVDGSRSADPPTSSGSASASACITASEAFRVARPFSSAENAAAPRPSPSGSSPPIAPAELRREIRKRAAVGASRCSQRSRAFLPFVERARGNSRAPRRECRTAGSIGQPRFCFAALTSSGPSGEPCASNVPALCGAP